MPHTDPASFAVVVTPSDTTNLKDLFSGEFPRGLYVGGTGNLTVVMAGDRGADTTVLFSAVPAGALLPIRVKRVMAATTATLIVAIG